MADLVLTKPSTFLTDNKIALGQAGLYWAPRGMVTAATVWTHIGEVLLGTASFNQDPAARTDINVEERDAPIYTAWEKSGGLTYEGDIPNLSKECVSFLLGGVVDATSDNVVDLPDDTFIQEGMFWFLPKTGPSFVFTNASLVSNIAGNASKTETLNIHIQVAANAGGGTGFEPNAVKLVY